MGEPGEGQAARRVGELQPVDQSVGPDRLRADADVGGRHAGNVGEQGEQGGSRNRGVQVACRASVELHQHGQRHHGSADDQIGPRLGEAVLVHAIQHADPEHRERRQGDRSEAPVVPVVAAALQQRLARLHDERRDRVAEYEIGYSPFGQRPADRDLREIEIQYGRVDQQGGSENIVRQHVQKRAGGEAVALIALAVPVEDQEQNGPDDEQRRHSRVFGESPRAVVQYVEDVHDREENGAGGQKGRQRDQPARDRVGQVAQDPFDEARVVALPAAGKDRERADDQRDRIGDRVDPAADVGPQERDGGQRRKTVDDPAARAAAPPVRQQREREKDRHQRQVIGHAAQRMFPVQRVNREKVQRQQHFGRGFPGGQGQPPGPKSDIQFSHFGRVMRYVERFGYFFPKTLSRCFIGRLTSK